MDRRAPAPVNNRCSAKLFCNTAESGSVRAAAGNKIFEQHTPVKGHSSRHQLPTACVPDRDRVHRTRIASDEKLLARGRNRSEEYRDALIVEAERFRRLVDAVAESDAQCAIDADAKPVDDPLVVLVRHIPSSPSSTRARSITAGVISAMPRSTA